MLDSVTGERIVPLKVDVTKVLPFGVWIPGRSPVNGGRMLGARAVAYQPFEVDGIRYTPDGQQSWQRGFFSLEDDIGCERADSTNHDLDELDDIAVIEAAANRHQLTRHA